MYNAPMVQDFKNQFYRDFPYGTDPKNGVLDQDITVAYNMVDNSINQALWSNQSQYTMAYLFLAAHYLVLNLRSASQGLNGQYTWMQNSKSVGAVSESFTIPQRIIDNPDFAAYTKTNYGARYLEFLWPQIAGQTFTVAGRTKP